MKKLFVAFITVICMCAVTVVGCTFGKLDAPTINEVKYNVVYWGSVDGAESYIINIDGFYERSTDDLKFDLSEVLEESGSGVVKVKAKGNGILNSDSAWSNEVSYTYNRNINDEGVSKWNAENCYLGRSLNTLDSNKMDASVFKATKIIEDYSVIDATGVPNSNTKANLSYINNFQEYSEYKKEEYGFSRKANFPLYYVDVGLSTKFDYTNIEEYKQKSNHYYVLLEINSKKFSYASSLKNKNIIEKLWTKDLNGGYVYLNDDFVNSLLNDTPEDFFNNYGTHMLSAYAAGGSAYVSFVGNSDEKIASTTGEDKFNIEGSVNILSEKVGVSASYYQNLKEENSSISGSTVGNLNQQILGGEAMYVGNAESLFNGENDATVNEWIASIGKANEYIPGYSNAVILMDEELDFIPLWDLLPDDNIESLQRKSELKEYYDGEAAQKQAALEREKYFKFIVDKGDGSQKNPYKICNFEDFGKIGNNLNNENVYFKLCADIDIVEELNGNNWTPIGDNSWKKGNRPSNRFMGKFDGNGKTITYQIKIRSGFSDLTYIYSYGLFGALENATISNLNVVPKIETVDENSKEAWDINNDNCPHGPIAGGIAGWMKNCTIQNCNIIDGKINLAFQGNRNEGCTRVGGMAGFAERTIFSGGLVQGYYYARGFNAACGGVVGTVYNNCQISVGVSLSQRKAESGWFFGSAHSGDKYGSSDGSYNL
ncbi:MAG: hypothetical protein E7350_03065 [Clostridiales bacterium]|nr:hypothetical protein [Clostridiales bacterium]